MSTDTDDGALAVVPEFDFAAAYGDVLPALVVDDDEIDDDEIKAARGITHGRMLEFVPLADVHARRTRWLWDGKIPLGTATLLAGYEKMGKSTLSVDLAARLSRGDLPGELHGHAANALIVSYEDSPELVKLRAKVAGADLRRVGVVKASVGGDDDTMVLPDDMDELRALVIGHGVQLIVVDPIMAAIDGKTNSQLDPEMRRVIGPLVRLGDELGVSTLILAHPNKRERGDVLARIGGSRAITAAVRSILIFGQPPDVDDDSPARVLAHAACNVGPMSESVAYRIETADTVDDNGEAATTSRLVPDGESELTANQLIQPRAVKSDDDGTAAERVADELRELADETPDDGWKVADLAAAIGRRRDDKNFQAALSILLAAGEWSDNGRGGPAKRVGPNRGNDDGTVSMPATVTTVATVGMVEPDFSDIPEGF